MITVGLASSSPEQTFKIKCFPANLKGGGREVGEERGGGEGGKKIDSGDKIRTSRQDWNIREGNSTGQSSSNQEALA